MIYVLRDTNRNVKIGFTRDRRSMKQRVATLQVGVSTKLQMECLVAGSSAHEAALHDLLAAHRRRGEWFDADADLVRHVVHLLEGYGPAFVLQHTAEQLLAFSPIGRRFPNWAAFPVVPD